MGKTRLNRFIACVLAFCMFASGIFISDYGMLTAWAAENTTEMDEEATEEESSASKVIEEKSKDTIESEEAEKQEESEEVKGPEEPDKPTDSTTVYFYNSEGWTTVGVHAWHNINGTDENLTGDWGSTTATSSDKGNDWVEVEISAVPKFSIILFDKDGNPDENRSTLDINNASDIYVTIGGKSYASQKAAEEAISSVPEEPTPEEPKDPTDSTTVYFYNSEGWTTVGAHAWNSDGDLTGGWGTTTAKPSDKGDDWVEVDIPAAPKFSIILFDKDGNPDANRSTVDINNTSDVYVTIGGKSYSSQKAAEEAISSVPEEPTPEEPKDPSNSTIVYFYNSEGWTTVGVHAWHNINGTDENLTGDWGTTTAKPSDKGDDWVEVDIPAAPKFSIILFDKDGNADANRSTVDINNTSDVYVTIGGKSYASQEDAEKAVKEAPTTIYFLNYDGENKKFDEVYAYAYKDGKDIASGWPGEKATEATDKGENWWKVEIPNSAASTPFTVIFNDGNGNQLDGIDISNYDGNYVTAKADAVYTTQNEAERSVGIINETVIYYLNSERWEKVSAYVYGDAGEALGGWPGKDAEPATEFGELWLKVAVPAKPKFSIIFSNQTEGGDQDAERAELLIESAKMVYVAGCKADGNAAAYGSQEEAELAMGMGDPGKMVTLYFYNSRGWGDINGYVFREEDGESITVGSGWPGKAAEKDATVGSGENWWKLLVPRIPTKENPFYVIFNDGLNQTDDILLDGIENVYITAAGDAYPTAEEAEAAAAKDNYDDGCEKGPNADLDGYDVNYNGAGAALPYITYEAEKAATNAEVLEKATDYRDKIQSEASGRQAVKLDAAGEYVEFTLTESANAFVLRYCIPDSTDGTGINENLSMYINGSKNRSLVLTSKYAWVYGGYPYNNNPNNKLPHRFFDETRILLDEILPAGTTVRLQKDEGDNAAYYIIDFLEAEWADSPLEQPENSLSVTDFGAVADDGEDDRAAFEDCIAAAKKQGKEVWIPAGNFDLKEKEALEAVGVTIRGAGMWHTNLNGAGAAFKYQGTSKFYDFAMTGVSTVRDDSGDLGGFEGNGKHATNITIQNIWMEHIKVGVWSADTDRMVIQGCRIRNTYADGINLCSGTHNTTVRNNSLRNTGDDCIAIWPWLADCSGNTIEHNTVQIPTLANGIAIYGGGNNVVDNNYATDIINNGAGIVVGSEFPIAKGYTGEITVKNNVLDRCGSMQTDENYMIGAIWIWSSLNPMTTGYYVYNNQMSDCPQVGITIECKSDLTGLNIQNNTINGAKHAIFEYLDGTGSGKLGNLTAENITGERIKDDAPNFILTEIDEEIVDRAELKQLVTQYNKIERGNYTQETWDEFIKVLNKAKEVAEDANASQSDIDAAKDALEAAYRGLKEAGEESENQKFGDVLPEDIPADQKIPDGLWIAGIAPEGYVYTGKAITPEVRIYDSTTLLTPKTDYTISYKNNTKVYDISTNNTSKMPTISVTGKGNYSGKETSVFKIFSPDINTEEFEVDDLSVPYNAKKTQKPVPILWWNGKSLKNKTDYTVTYYDSTGTQKLNAVKDAGDYYVEIAGKGNFSGTRRVKLTVSDNLKMISKVSVSKIANQIYTGSEATPALTVKDGKNKLDENTHYTVRYINNVDIGTAYALITGMGSYSGTKRVAFRITGASIAKASVTIPNQTYNGIAVEPEITLTIKDNNGTRKTLKKGEDYTIQWQNNRNTGTATAVFTGIKYYTGTMKKTFKIQPFNISTDTDSRFSVAMDRAVPYAKGGAKPVLSVTFKKTDGTTQKLVEGTDYTVIYGKNTFVNDNAFLTIKGKGNFSGTRQAENYSVTKQDIGNLTLMPEDKTYQNKKNIYATKVTITDLDGKVLSAGKDYDKKVSYTYKNDTILENGTLRTAGTAVDKDDIIPAGTVITVTATAKGENYAGNVSGDYRITKFSLSSSKVTIPVQEYTGKPISLTESQITVKVKNETLLPDQYRIVPGSYKNNTKKGTASVTIEGLGNYGGTKNVRFKIKAKGFLWWLK